MYIAGPGSYDLSGDGTPDLILYAQGDSKPENTGRAQVYELGKDVILTDDNKGYFDFHKNVERNGFNEERDYLYPIPINERSLNKNLTQNPGWKDGLGF